MHIALFLPHLDVSGGLGVHCRMVLNALLQQTEQHRYTIYTPRDPSALFPTVAQERFETIDPRLNITRLEIPAGFNLANELDSILAQPLVKNSPDLLYCSYYTGMKSPPCPQIVAFHDAGFLENPEGFGATASIRRKTINEIRSAIDCIQCISHDACDRICRILPWPKEKTAVVWHALADSHSEIETAKTSKPIAEYPKPYFFSPVGAATGFNRKRKNVPLAVSAYRQIPKGTARFIIAGTAALSEKVLMELLPEFEKGKLIGEKWVSDDHAITILPTVTRPEFLQLMRHAAAVVYPSRYEGFGLPTIEAMAVGTPLIAARATSIPEIVAEAGILVDPDDQAGFANAMNELLNNQKISQQLVTHGNKRISLFSPVRLGRDMLNLFESVSSHSFSLRE